jgi:hypothetical protein
VRAVPALRVAICGKSDTARTLSDLVAERPLGTQHKPSADRLGGIGGPGYNVDPFSGHEVMVDFDNFTVTGADPICPPGAQGSS